jgi:hypothetical protein
MDDSEREDDAGTENHENFCGQVVLPESSLNRVISFTGFAISLKRCPDTKPNQRSAPIVDSAGGLYDVTIYGEPYGGDAFRVSVAASECIGCPSLRSGWKRGAGVLGGWRGAV